MSAKNTKRNKQLKNTKAKQQENTKHKHKQKNKYCVVPLGCSCAAGMIAVATVSVRMPLL